ncbi:DUF397 domain-containing protein [Streptomyces noursei]|uniref:DUF397 domain-containing protein n=1 Tax=Streptomyces noursei TaxID=1971 RepID=UPI001674C332|nr:DUF397 domain-containing protein [Streptomyces noursei]MCZ1018354.1 DUF397 domain-containing protein [Streptomyces noursei]GGW88335.1 hypothetical protein GCM10010341_06380 [Streptomyces noursei]
MNVDTTTQDPYQLTWTKSSYSSEEGGECVEVATDLATVHIRDSKDVTQCALTASPAAWSAFVGFAIAHAS